MKLMIYLFFCIALISAQINLIKKGRSLNTEKVALELDYMGSCEKFNKNDLASVKISTHTSGNCLPLVNGGEVNNETGFVDPNTLYPDLADLQCDYFCTDRDGGVSIIHFVEIYDSNRTEVKDYILSFVPSSPFKSRSKETVYVRRPSCATEVMFCNGAEQVVSCQPNVKKKNLILKK